MGISVLSLFVTTLLRPPICLSCLAIMTSPLFWGIYVQQWISFGSNNNDDACLQILERSTNSTSTFCQLLIRFFHQEFLCWESVLELRYWQCARPLKHATLSISFIISIYRFIIHITWVFFTNKRVCYLIVCNFIYPSEISTETQFG